MKQQLCLCVVFLLGSPTLACTQQAAQQTPPDSGTAATSAVPRDSPEGLLQLDLVVTDATGTPVAGLNQADFTLLENGHPQNVISFQSFDGRGTPPEPPVKIILLIDTIELPEILANKERLAVMTYLRKRGGLLQRPASVFMLADSGLWTVAPSGDGNVLAREIERNQFTLVRHNAGWQRSASAPGSKDPASQSALKALGQIATEERTRPGRKLLLWIGPGWGLGSGAYADVASGSPPVFGAVWWFSDLLREAHLVLYSFTVGENSPNALLYKDYLDGVRVPKKATFMNVYRKVLAVQSGGRVMEEGLDVEKQIESCILEAGPFYQITFDPLAADHPNEFHDLKIVVNRPGLIARTNTGYYDQPYYSADLIPQPRSISVPQLEQILTESHRESDTDLAKELSGLALTQRLSEQKLSSLNAAVAGKRSREELRILADSSAFLAPPVDETPHDAPPDLATQQHILSLASTYLKTTVSKLPDFFARRTTVRYQETPQFLEGRALVSYHPLHVTDSSTTTVHYRNGFEIADTKLPKRKPNDPELITYGVFGPALEGVQIAIDKNTGVSWMRWENGPRGRVAVFRYSVPLETSTRQVLLCCLPDGDGTHAFQRYAAYHEEIAIDPDTGAILRLEFRVDLKSLTPLTRSDIMIEYGPVDIGGKTYICPLRSVSISRGRSVGVLSEWDESFRTYGPYATMLNDITFDQYHLFRSESHILLDSAQVQ